MKNIARGILASLASIILIGCATTGFAEHPEITKPEDQMLQGLGYDRAPPNRNQPAAFYWYHKAAMQGYAPAQNSLGSMYQEIHDYISAASWYRKAADQNNVEAINSLGYLYNYGLGVQKDEVLAVKFYETAANGGMLYAMFNLGLSYQNGEGVAQDYVQADMWFNLIQRNSHSLPPLKQRVKRVSEKLEANMTKEQITQSARLADAWFDKHSEN